MTDVFGYLNRQGIPYAHYEHPPALTIRESADVGDIKDGLHCKNLFLCNRQATRFFLLCMPGYKRYDASRVSRQIAPSRLHFASDEMLYAMLGLRPGCVSPFALLHAHARNVALALDEDLLKEERLSFHPSRNTATVVLSQEAFRQYLQGLDVEPLLFQLN